MPKVSIVVPVYNTSKFLRKCLDSLVAQSLREIEIICVNDGSTDDSPAIIAEYAGRDDRVKLISQVNKGYGAAMNLGFDCAKGEYVGIVESDDFADTEMFEQIYDYAHKNAADVVKSNYYRLYQNNSEEVQTYPLLRLSEGQYDPYDYTDMFFEQRNWTGLYRRAFIEHNNIKHNVTKGASFQDVSFNFIVMSQAERFFFLPKAFLHYRMDNPASSIHSGKKTFALCDEMAFVENYLRSHASSEDKIWNILANVRFRLYQRDFTYRIYPDDKISFLKKAIDEYKADKTAGRYIQTLWSQTDWEALQIVLKDDEKYLADMKKILDKRIGERTSLLAKIQSYQPVYVYGAGKVGHEVIGDLRDYGIEPVRVLVNDVDANPGECCGIPVCDYTDPDLDRKEAVVITALGERLLDQVGDALMRDGYNNVIKMNCERRRLFNNNI